MKPADIVQVSAYYPPHLGGQEYLVQDLATQLAAAGHHVQVLASALGKESRGPAQSPAARVGMEAGVTVQRLGAVEFGHAAIMPAFAYQLFRAAGRGSIVHVHIGQAFTPEMVWLVSKLRRFPYIAELHIDFEPSGPAAILLPLYKHLILRRVLRAAAAVVVLNDKTLKVVRDTYGYTGRAFVISNGIGEEYFEVHRSAPALTPPPVLRLLFVGRLSKQKNLPALLHALKHTKRDVSLEIVGDGDEAADIAALARYLRLTNVKLLGRLPRADILALYATRDALILPSLYEAQPLVLLEAMATRIPIIGANVVGVAEHIAGGGIVIEPTAEGIAEGFEQYFLQYDALPAMVDHSYAKVAKLRWRTLLKDYERLYAQALHA